MLSMSIRCKNADKMKMKKILLFIIIILTARMSSCEQKNELKSGIWRGELAVSGGRKAPFLFEVEKHGIDSVTFTLLNGEERVKLPGVTFHGDTLIVPIVAFDTEIRGFVTNDRIEGKFIKNYIEDDPGVPFSAVYGVEKRFEPAAQPTTRQIDGKWEVLFLSEDGDTTRNAGDRKSVV